MEQLPQTASQLPFWGLIGSLSLGAGFALMWVLKRKKLAK
jgi:LPXTG-motif cell wall-anchored protein